MVKLVPARMFPSQSIGPELPTLIVAASPTIQKMFRERDTPRCALLKSNVTTGFSDLQGFLNVRFLRRAQKARPMPKSHPVPGSGIDAWLGVLVKVITVSVDISPGTI